MYGDIKGVVEIREGDSRLPSYREQASRQVDRQEVDNKKEDSRVLDIMEVDSRKEGSRGVDYREVKGPGADPHRHSGASFRTGVTEGKPVNSSIMIREKPGSNPTVDKNMKDVKIISISSPTKKNK